MIRKQYKDSSCPKRRLFLHLEMEEYSLKNTLRTHAILNSRFWQMNKEIRFIYLKENAQSKGEIKKLLKKLHHHSWIQSLVIKWELNLSNWQQPVVTTQQVQLNS